MVVQDLSLPRGDNRTYLLEVEDENGKVFSLTGATVWFTLKEKISDGDAAAKIQLSSANINQIEIHDPGNGKALIKLTNAQTQDLEIRPYVYDVQVKNSLNEINTVTKGSLAIVGDVTRTI